MESLAGKTTIEFYYDASLTKPLEITSPHYQFSTMKFTLPPDFLNNTK